ncbi:MAG: AAA family ATPase [Planctomycetaceae bacterium]|nr:AAA family ATPase [Planctomycetaceae bacterium]
MRDTTWPEVIIGRQAERRELDHLLQSKSSELLAVYGRRRVGKTFLIRQHYRQQMTFEASGIHGVSLRQQLESFGIGLEKWFPQSRRGIPASWMEAFHWLQTNLEASNRRKTKQVLFFDEFPWFASQRSGFLSAFEWFWNSFASRRPDLIVVICGSAAAWMIRKVIQSRGGLHNRVTQRLRLLPFSLKETKEYLAHRRVILDPFQIAQVYMGIGGIPHYLNLVRPGMSAAQILQQTCLAKTAPLRDEYQHLYAALFNNYHLHEAIVATLAKSQTGLSREKLLLQAKLNSGGGVSTALEELIAAGFVSAMPAFGNRAKETTYYLSDEFSHFYWTWMVQSRNGLSWADVSNSRRWASWCGYAFESLCRKHINAIKIALGISAVETSVSAWRYQPSQHSDDEGTQIDLLIDRADRCIHLCEMKFSQNPFIVDKRGFSDLARKQRVFQLRTASKKTLFLTMITANGLKPSSYSEQIPCQIELTDLFQTNG